MDESAIKRLKKYNDSANAIGYKMGIRFIYDHKEQGFDIANAEVALLNIDATKNMMKANCSERGWLILKELITF